MGREHWVETTLNKVVLHKKGKKPKKLERNEFHNSLPYIDIEAFETGNIRQYADIESSNCCNNNDVLVVWDGARFGLTGYNQRGSVGSTLACLTPVIIETTYLLHFIQRQYKTIQSNPKGTGIPHVNPDIFWSLKIPLPPLNEQKRIVEKVDAILPKVKSAKARLEKISAILKKFRQSVLSAACSWRLTEDWREGKDFPEWKDVVTKEVCVKITDGEHNTPRRVTNGKMLLSAKNIRDGFIDYNNFDCICESDFSKCIKRCHPEIGDVLVVSVGATIGRTAIMRKNQEFAIVRSVGLFKPNKNMLLGEYLLHALRTSSIQKYINGASQGTAQPCFYINKMEHVPISLPSLEEQQEIVRRVEKLFALADSLEAKYQTAVERVEKIEQSVLAKAFRGELAERDPNDEPAEELLRRILDEKAKLEGGRNTKSRRVSKAVIALS